MAVSCISEVCSYSKLSPSACECCNINGIKLPLNNIVLRLWFKFFLDEFLFSFVSFCLYILKNGTTDKIAPQNNKSEACTDAF